MLKADSHPLKWIRNLQVECMASHYFRKKKKYEVEYGFPFLNLHGQLIITIK